MTKKTVWRKGPPPSVGWWPASICKDKRDIRWWNGFIWSLPTFKGKHAIVAGELAEIGTHFQESVEWTDRPASWPERSRT